jgi:hypothetical protein
VKRLLPFVLVAAAVTAYPAGAGAATLKGIVVARDGAVALVASPAGVVTAVQGRAGVGSRVVTRGASLAVVGHARHALVRGVLVRRVGRVRFISAANHVLVVRGGLRALSSATDTTPLPGAVVSTNVTVTPGGLTSTSEQEVGRAQNAQVEATVASIGTGTVTLTVQGQTLTLTLPAGLTLPQTLVGSKLTLKLGFANGNAEVDDAQGDNQDDTGDDDSNDDGGHDQSGHGGGHDD